MKDYYYILGLDRVTCSSKDIKRAYKKLSLKFHPDLNNNDLYFENRFKDILEAYDILKDETKRKLYNGKLDDFLENHGGRAYQSTMNSKYEEELKKYKNQYRDLKKKYNAQQEKIQQKSNQYNKNAERLRVEKQKLEREKEDIENRLKKVSDERLKKNKKLLLISVSISAVLLLGFIIRKMIVKNELETKRKEVFDCLNGEWFIDSLSVNNTVITYDKNKDIDYYDFLGEACTPKKLIFKSENGFRITTLDSLKSEEFYRLEIIKEELCFINNGTLLKKIEVKRPKIKSTELSFISSIGDVNIYLSQRKIIDFRLGARKELSISEFKLKMEEAQRLIDDNKEYCQAIKQMLEIGNLVKGKNAELYMSGFYISLLRAVSNMNNYGLEEKLIQEIIENKNHLFYAVEYVSNTEYGEDSNIKVVQWDMGYTQAVAERILLLRNVENTTSEIKKAELNKEYAKRWYNYSWGRLESGAGMSYSDSSVEYIFYKAKIEPEIQEKMLIEIVNSVEGSAKGNAYYCLYLMNKNSYYKEKGLNYLRKSINIFENLPSKRFHNNMLRMAKAQLKIQE